MTIPNILTIFRIFLVPIFIGVSFSSYPYKYKIMFFILLISGITDVTDGVIARRFNMKSKLGALLDPVADKLIQISVFVCLSLENIIPLWLLVVTFTKEFLMFIGASILLKSKTVISADYSGKIATLVFYISSLIFIIFSPSEFIKNVLFFIIALSALYAFTNYSIIFYKTIVKENDRNVQTYKH